MADARLSGARASAACPAAALENLQVEARCSVCLGYLKEPVVIKCGHTFCRACITHWWKGLEGHFPCPVCRKASRHRSLRPNWQLGSMVEIAKQLRGVKRKTPEESLFCHEDQEPVCLVCGISHTLVPVDNMEELSMLSVVEEEGEQLMLSEEEEEQSLSTLEEGDLMLSEGEEEPLMLSVEHSLSQRAEEEQFMMSLSQLEEEVQSVLSQQQEEMQSVMSQLEGGEWWLLSHLEQEEQAMLSQVEEVKQWLLSHLQEEGLSLLSSLEEEEQ